MSPTKKVKKTIVEPIPFYSIHHDTEPGFDLYYKIIDGESKKKYKRVIPSGGLYCYKTRSTLAKQNTQELFIKAEDRDTYMDYMEKHLSSITKDSSVPLREKSKTLYTSASKVLEKIFDKPESKENVHKVKNLVGNTIDIVLSDERSIRSLIEVSSYDYYTYTHSVDVAVYSVGFGHHMNFSMEDLKKLGYAAMMHDIGKSKIPSEVINKNGRLSDQEFEMIKRHPDYGHDIMSTLGEEDPAILSGIRHHHEKHDGTGYPDNLKGKDIPLFAQIISISDVFSALSTKRSYKDAYSSFNALKLMKDEMAGNFEPKFLLSFIQFMGRHYAK